MDENPETHNRLVEDTSLPLVGKRYATTKYTKDYQDEVFYIWYRTNRPRAAQLRGKVEPTIDGVIPPESALKLWIREIFEPKAVELDQIVKEQMDEKSIKEKVEMLSRHADQAKQVQKWAMEYLEDHKEDLKTNTAVRLLVEGYKMERESRGLPTLITETINKTDEDIERQLKELLDKAMGEDDTLLDEGENDEA